MKYLIIIPTYNERENIGVLLDKIKELTFFDVDILVVDDNSPDQTGELVKSRQQNQANLFLLARPGKQGLGAAYQAGFDWGLKNNYDVLIQMDADLSHDPRYLPRLISRIRSNDFVIGSRYVCQGGTEGWGILRRWLSVAGNLYARLILGMDIKDFTGGFNAWRAEVLKKIGWEDIHSNGYSFQIELKYRAAQNGFSYSEIPIIFTERRTGQSKMDFRIIKEAVWMTLYLRFKSLSWGRKIKKYRDNV